MERRGRRGASRHRYSLTVAPLVIKDKVVIDRLAASMACADFSPHSTRRAAGSLAVPHHRGTRRTRSRDVGRRFVEDRRRLDLGHGHVRCRAQSHLLGCRQPGARLERRRRLGDNLYSDSVVALDADTGALKWHFQFTPHDVRLRLGAGAGAGRHPVAGPDAEGDALRQPQRLLLCARPRDGRVPAREAVYQGHVDDRSRCEGTAAEHGAAVRGRRPDLSGRAGGTNWYSPSFSPRTGLFYLPMWGDTFSTFTKRPVEYKEGQRFTGALPAMPIRLLTPGPAINRRRPEDGYGGIQAIDPRTGDKKWE